MSDTKIQEIADKADMIIRGYAFTREDALIRILNLNDRESSMVITSYGIMVETNMDEIEQVIVKNIWDRDSKYMEAYDA